MLARKYDNYAWEIEEAENSWEQEDLQAWHERYRLREDKRLRHRIGVIVTLILMGYFAMVMLSNIYSNQTNALLKLKEREENLITANEALRIEVDYLKSPVRITKLAGSKLGMKTARSNIYVQAGGSNKSSNDSYAYAHN